MGLLGGEAVGGHVGEGTAAGVEEGGEVGECCGANFVLEVV